MNHDEDMTCDELKQKAAAYALGVLDEAERMGCARHLARPGPHAGCRDAVNEAQLVTARLAAVLPARQPSAAVWQAIEASVRAQTRAPSDPTGRGRRLWELADWLVAATVLGLYLTNAPVDTRRRLETQERERPTRRPTPALPATAR